MHILEFVGTYQVLAERDLETGKIPKDESFDDFYIPCKNGRILETSNSKVYCYYVNKLTTGRAMIRRLEKRGVEIVASEETDAEVLIYFYKDQMKVAAKVLKASIEDKKINPLTGEAEKKRMKREAAKEKKAKEKAKKERKKRAPKQTASIRCITTGDVFADKKAAADYVGVSPAAIYGAIKGNRPCKGYMFEEVK